MERKEVQYPFFYGRPAMAIAGVLSQAVCQMIGGLMNGGCCNDNL
jgi:hypothetical protein